MKRYEYNITIIVDSEKELNIGEVETLIRGKLNSMDTQHANTKYIEYRQRKELTP